MWRCIMTTATVPTIEVSPWAVNHARMERITPILQHMVDVTPRIFPGLRSLNVQFQMDWAAENEFFFIFEAHVVLDPGEDRLTAIERWKDEFFNAYPMPRFHNFVLDLREVAA
jgi:hypothetical protein